MAGPSHFLGRARSHWRRRHGAAALVDDSQFSRQNVTHLAISSCITMPAGGVAVAVSGDRLANSSS